MNNFIEKEIPLAFLRKYFSQHCKEKESAIKQTGRKHFSYAESLAFIIPSYEKAQALNEFVESIPELGGILYPSTVVNIKKSKEGTIGDFSINGNEIFDESQGWEPLLYNVIWDGQGFIAFSPQP